MATAATTAQPPAPNWVLLSGLRWMRPATCISTVTVQRAEVSGKWTRQPASLQQLRAEAMAAQGRRTQSGTVAVRPAPRLAPRILQWMARATYTLPIYPTIVFERFR